MGNTLRSGDALSVVAVFENSFYFWDSATEKPLYNTERIPNSNTLPKSMMEAMALYGIKRDEFFSCGGKRIGGSPQTLKLDPAESIDVNTPVDLCFARNYGISECLRSHQTYDSMSRLLSSCIVADVLREFGFDHDTQVVSPLPHNSSWSLSSPKVAVFGRAKTLQIRPLAEGESADDIYSCLSHYETVAPGDIIFVHNMIPGRAYFGDLNAAIATRCQARAAIIHGFTRDQTRTDQAGFPVFCAAYTCADVKGYGTLDTYNSALRIGTVDICVNDLVFADADGVVVVPQYVEKAVLARCMEVASVEKAVTFAVAEGK